jgi:RNA polymerase sigma-70 factor (ECF subfamily)
VRDHDWAATEEQAAPDGLGAEDRLALQAALAQLVPEQRAAVTLCLAEGWSHGEAAEALGLPLGTVKSHVARGRDRLLASLGERT